MSGALSPALVYQLARYVGDHCPGCSRHKAFFQEVGGAYLRITHLGYSACAQAVVWALAERSLSLAHYTLLLVSLTVGYCSELLCSAGGVFRRGVRWRFVLLSAGRDCGWL